MSLLWTNLSTCLWECQFVTQNVLSDAKVRVSYGEVPNIGSISTGTYGITGGLTSVANYLGPQLASFGTTTGFVGSGITGLVPTTAGNPSLRIETIKKTNSVSIGWSVSFWIIIIKY